MSIKIKKEKKVKDNGNWLVLTKVCNEEKKDQKVVVTNWPYDKNGRKIGKKKDRPETTRTIKAGKCEWFVFEWSTEPKKAYTDVFDAAKYNPKTQEGGIPLAATYLNDLASHNIPKSESGNGEYFAVFPLPYPNRHAHTEEPKSFFIDCIEGIPEGWEVEAIYPKLGEPFVRQPYDRETSGVIRLKAPKDSSTPSTETGGVSEPFSLTIHYREVGKPNEINWAMRNTLLFTQDEIGPDIQLAEYRVDQNHMIHLRVQASDPSGIRQVQVKFSTDQGETFSYKNLTAPLRAYMPEEDDAADPIEFEGIIGPFKPNQMVQLAIRAEDEVANTSMSHTKAVDLSVPSRIESLL